MSTDLDGVLCENPDESLVHNYLYYSNFLRVTKPKSLPPFEVQEIITGRSRRYRAVTEKWLSEHGVLYKELVMIPSGSLDRRIMAEFKAKVYKFSSATVFIESDLFQARLIFALTGKLVYCIEE